MPDHGDWLGLLDPLRTFFAELPAGLAQQPQIEAMTAAVEAYLVQQRGLGSVERVDRLDKEIEWFYRIDLEGTGQLEAFEVRYVDWEGSTLPDGQLVLWGVAEHTVDRWAVNRYPRGWKLVLGLPLGLRAGEAAAEGVAVREKT